MRKISVVTISCMVIFMCAITTKSYGESELKGSCLSCNRIFSFSQEETDISCPYCGTSNNLAQAHERWKYDEAEKRKERSRERAKARHDSIWKDVSNPNKEKREIEWIVPFPQKTRGTIKPNRSGGYTFEGTTR